MLDRRINLFMMVADAGSILAAAKRLYMSQPTLSQQIHSLENDLNITLFERTSRGVKLTPAGKRLYGEFKKINQEISSLLDVTRNIEGGAGVALRLGGDRRQRDVIMSDMLVEFRRQYPDAEVTYTTMKSEELPAAIAEGRIDVATYAASPRAREYKCQWDLVRSYDVGICVPVNHPLASKDLLKLADLDGRNIALAAYGHFDSSDAIRTELCSSPFDIKLFDVDDDEVPEHYLIRGWMPVVPHPYLFERPNVHAIRLDIPETIPMGLLTARNRGDVVEHFIEIARETCNSPLEEEAESSSQ